MSSETAVSHLRKAVVGLKSSKNVRNDLEQLLKIVREVYGGGPEERSILDVLDIMENVVPNLTIDSVLKMLHSNLTNMSTALYFIGSSHILYDEGETLYQLPGRPESYADNCYVLNICKLCRLADVKPKFEVPAASVSLGSSNKQVLSPLVEAMNELLLDDPRINTREAKSKDKYWVKKQIWKFVILNEFLKSKPNYSITLALLPDHIQKLVTPVQGVHPWRSGVDLKLLPQVEFDSIMTLINIIVHRDIYAISFLRAWEKVHLPVDEILKTSYRKAGKKVLRPRPIREVRCLSSAERTILSTDSVWSAFTKCKSIANELLKSEFDALPKALTACRYLMSKVYQNFAIVRKAAVSEGKAQAATAGIQWSTYNIPPDRESKSVSSASLKIKADLKAAGLDLDNLFDSCEDTRYIEAVLKLTQGTSPE